MPYDLVGYLRTKVYGKPHHAVAKFHDTRDSFRMESAATSNTQLRQFTDHNVPNLEATLNDAIHVMEGLPPVGSHGNHAAQNH